MWDRKMDDVMIPEVLCKAMDLNLGSIFVAKYCDVKTRSEMWLGIMMIGAPIRTERCETLPEVLEMLLEGYTRWRGRDELRGRRTMVREPGEVARPGQQLALPLDGDRCGR